MTVEMEELSNDKMNPHPPSDAPSGGKPGLDLWSVQGILTAIIKIGNQSSPLRLEKMPTRVSLMIIAALFFGWIFAFSYTLSSLYGNCTKENNCVTCSITVDYIEGSDCDQLATTDLTINSGCVSVPLDNEYNIIVDIVSNINSRVDYLHQQGMLPDQFYTSIMYHQQITTAMRGNGYNQMIDPDLDEVRSWFSNYFIGFNQALSYDPYSLPDSLVIAAGIKAIFSYITLGCVLSSSSNFSSISIENDKYWLVTLNASNIQCPTSITTVGATFDQAIAANVRTNGLGPVNLSLPFEYIQLPPASPKIEIAPAEMLYSKNDQVAHCPTSVFTMAPSTLNTVFYECCVEKTNLEKLAQANAFAGLVLTFAVVATTLAFWPWNPIDQDDCRP